MFKLQTHKKAANLKFYTQLQYLPQVKAKQSHFPPEKQKLKEFTTSKPTLQEMFKKVLQEK